MTRFKQGTAENWRIARGLDLSQKLVITIDGPAGAGKSTVARALASALGYLYVDTGAMYRAVALKVLQSNISPLDQEAVSALMATTDIRLEAEATGTRVFLDGVDVTEDIRRPEVNSIVAVVAGIPEVRRQLVQQQRQYAQQGGVVLEGRDTGSHVAPDADVKVYLTADLSERVRRRWAQLKQSGYDVDCRQLEAEMKERDRQDSNRELNPLQIPEGAIVINSSQMGVEDVVNIILDICRQR